MAEWLSSCVEKQGEVGDALTDLAGKIREYADAGKPSACAESKGRFLTAELEWLRPSWKVFTGISVGFGIAGAGFSLLVTDSGADKWGDLALAVTVPVFVLGISLVAVARSMSEGGRFAVEYLNESCRMRWFCCLTLVAVLIGVVGRFLCTIEGVPNVVTGAMCAASLGVAIDCLAMLGFVVLETIRCSAPSKSISVVSQYAARKLSYAYLKEAYAKLFNVQAKEYLEKWCAGRAIHPPSQYYVHSLRSSLHSGEGENDVKIELDGRISGESVYKDYDLEGLAALDKYLKENGAELYLSSPVYESEQGRLGILSSENVRENRVLQEDLAIMGREAVRLTKVRFVEEDEDFWDGQQSKLYEAVERGVDKGDPIEVKAYLRAVNVPQTVLRQVRKKHKVVRDAYGEYERRGHDFLRLYLRALREILAVQERQPKHRVEDAYRLLRVVRNSIWEEATNILRDMDYHTMELFMWLVQQMYSVIEDAGEEAKAIREMRAQFGGFYDFAGGWIEDCKSGDVNEKNEMRLVLHEGLTKWLLVAIEKRDTELIEQLCDAGRQIVFGREGIKFEHREVVAQYLVLAGRLIGLAKGGKVTATAVERLFCERHSHDVRLNFEDLVRFYIEHSFPLKKLDSYLRIFFSPTKEGTGLLTGSSHSTGYGMTGVREMSLAFIFLAARGVKSGHDLPDPISDMAGKINEDDMNTVSEVFKGDMLGHYVEQLKGWIEKCNLLDDAEEAREIAEAEFNPEKVEEWKRKFWEGWTRATPVFAMCRKNGNYEIADGAKAEWHRVLPKIAVIDWKYPVSGAEGDVYGRECGQEMEKELVKKIVEHKGRESRVEGGMSEVVGKALSWLEKEGCDNDKGIVVVVSTESPESELYEDEDFVPSWKEDVRSREFEGFYRGFPIVWLDGEVNGEGDVKAVVVDMRGWRGIRVREEVVTKGRFGEVDVRQWSDKEIQDAIASEEPDVKDVDKAKGNCPVDVSCFWEYVEGELPKRKIFRKQKGKPNNKKGKEKKE